MNGTPLDLRPSDFSLDFLRCNIFDRRVMRNSPVFSLLPSCCNILGRRIMRFCILQIFGFQQKCRIHSYTKRVCENRNLAFSHTLLLSHMSLQNGLSAFMQGRFSASSSPPIPLGVYAYYPLSSEFVKKKSVEAAADDMA